MCIGLKFGHQMEPIALVTKLSLARVTSVSKTFRTDLGPGMVGAALFSAGRGKKKNLRGGAGRGKDKNLRGGAKKRVNRLIQKN